MSQPVALGEDPSRSPASAIPDIDERVLQLFAIVTDNLAGASQAFLSDDREAARALVAADQRVDSMEQDLLRLIDQRVVASPPPSAATLRLLFAVGRIVPELERSGDLVEHIALRTPQGMAARLSPKARGLIQQMGEDGVQMFRAAALAYQTRDPAAAEELRLVDDHLDDLHVRLCAELSATLDSIPIAIEMGLIARFLERLGDHAVNMARRVRDLSADAALLQA
jgi:phosphate transport system protein